MKSNRPFIFLHILLYSMLLIFIVIGFIKAAQGQEVFKEYLKEDGVVEYLTALFLLAVSVVSFSRFIPAVKETRWKQALTWSIFALMFFFATGEEISWGQRIFHLKSSEYFMENNLQQEINLHNLVIGNVKINKLIFSQLMTAGLLFYFLFLRIFAEKVKFVNKLVTGFRIPLPRWNHVVAMLVFNVLVSFYHLMKTAELRELTFSVIMFLIIMFPADITEIHGNSKT